MRIRHLVGLAMVAAMASSVSFGDPESRAVEPLETAVRERLSQPRGEGWTLHAAGFAFDARGYVFTNAHAVGRCGEITVTPAAGAPSPATLIAMDTRYDLAVLRLDTPFEDILPIGLPPGSPDVPVIVLSFSGPQLPGSGKRAFGSWLGKDPDGRDGLVALTSQVDDGQSGSPVLDTDGRVVGLVVGRQSDTGEAAVVSVSAMRSLLDYLGLAPPPLVSPTDRDLGPRDILLSNALVAVACK